MKVGLLALQGDFERHQKVLSKIGVDYIFVKNGSDLKRCDALILPGGESTTFINLLKASNLYEKVSKFGTMKPIMGTCAGLIIVAKRIINYNIETLNLINIEVERNAYGRQIDSFIDNIEIKLKDQKIEFEGVFIRAPKIKSIGEGVIPIGYHKEDIVMAENDKVLVCTFHPELSLDTRIHEYFLEKVR